MYKIAEYNFVKQWNKDLSSLFRYRLNSASRRAGHSPTGVHLATLRTNCTSQGSTDTRADC